MTQETTREFWVRRERMTRDEATALMRCRNEALLPLLRERLVEGDVLRAKAAECGAREATYKFSHWEGQWIVSATGRSIAPCSVYSVNGDVLRA